MQKNIIFLSPKKVILRLNLLITLDDLKHWLHKKLPREKKLSRADKLFLILAATTDGDASVTEIIKLAKSVGLREIKDWNPGAYLNRNKGNVVNINGRWELADAGVDRVKEIIGKTTNPTVAEPAVKLREYLAEIKNKQTYDFLETAILCHESEYYRPAILMAWVGAVQVLRQEVIDNHLDKYNEEGKRVYGKKWNIVEELDDFSEITESIFLDILKGIKMIPDSHKNVLKECLRTRNRCCHPNEAKIGPYASGKHIEMLYDHVFNVFNNTTKK